MQSKTNHYLLALLLAGSSLSVSAQQLAFPSAQGWGRYATGGRTGSVYHVTNLNDSGAGSLRDAVSQPNRIVVFDVAGVIKINSRMVFAKNLYVAGQTAPGEGVTVYGDGVSFSGATNTIVRYMRFRMGHNGSSGKDAAGISNGTNMIFDHCSFAWGLDETFSINPDGKGDLGNITIQNSVVGQGLLTHSAGGLMQADNITLYRNFYCDNSTRNNKVKGVNQYANNLVYNWQNGAYIMGGDSEGQSYCNIQGNLFINGPAVGGAAFTGGNSNFHFYGDDNWQDRNRDGQFNPVEVTDYSASDRQSNPYDYPELELWPGNSLIENLLPTVGASLPYRDYTDYYMIDEVMSFGTKGALISNEETLVYGAPSTWDVWKGSTRTDSDGDGMPDEWEKANGTNPNANDAMTIADNGYTNIENYINSITESDIEFHLRAPMCVEIAESMVNSLRLAWRDYTRGEEGFVVEIKGGKYEDFTEVGRTAAGVTAMTIEGLDAATAYTVRLRAFAGEQYSDYTAELVAKTRPVPVEMVDVEKYEADNTWMGGDGLLDLDNPDIWEESIAFTDDSKVLFDMKQDAVVTLNDAIHPTSVVVRGDANLTLQGTGSIDGNGSLNKAGDGKFTIETLNNYRGATVLHGGILSFSTLKNGGVASSIGASDEFAQNWIMDGGTYQYTGASTSTNRSALLYNETVFEVTDEKAVVTLNGTVEGSGNLVIDGEGQVNVPSSKFFAYEGDMVLRGGSLYLSTVEAAKAGIGSASRLVFEGGTLKTKGESNNYETYNFPIHVVEGTTSIFAPNRNCYLKSVVTGSGTLQWNIPYLREYIQGNFSGFTGRIIANGVGTDKNGSLFLMSSNKNIANAVVEAKGNTRVCIWDTNGNVTLGGLAGSSGTYLMGSSKNTKGFSCTWKIGSANTDETFSGIINDWSCSGSGYTGTVNIVKQGSGDWRLKGANTYSGSTIIEGGRLIVDGTNSGKGAITVKDGTTLAGSGSVASVVTLQEGATLMAGPDSAMAKRLTVKSNVKAQDGSIIHVAVGAEKCNSLSVTGDLILGENVTLQLAPSLALPETPVVGTSYQLLKVTGSITGTFAEISPLTPGEGLAWDSSELYTTGVLKVAASSTGIVSAEKESPVADRDYFSPAGLKGNQPHQGLNILRERHADGSVVTKKVMEK
ncbi:MAG: autotransporter-associated beta strand repeat-containing protein [Prevotella sp.]